jgi:hypothetical protein
MTFQNVGKFLRDPPPFFTSWMIGSLLDDLTIWEIGVGFPSIQSNKKRFAVRVTPKAVTSEVNGGAGAGRIARNSVALDVGVFIHLKCCRDIMILPNENATGGSHGLTKKNEVCPTISFRSRLLP